MTLDPFVMPKPKQPFAPIDVVRASAVKLEKHRGRSPKESSLRKKIKTEQYQQNENIEVIEDEVNARLIEEDAKEEKKDEGRNSKKKR